MPRDYMCRKCGRSHQPPTGKKCRLEEVVDELEEVVDEVEDGVDTVEDGEDTMPLLRQLKRQMDAMEENMKEMQEARRVETEERNSAVVPVESQQQNSAAGSDMQIVHSATLRNDIRAMQRAAQRIAQFKDDQLEEDELGATNKSTSNGKKSGSLLVAADRVDNRIDWPHMYVTRGSAGSRIPVPYKELKVDEFVFGFLEMLDSPKFKWDREMMLKIFKMLMQDSMDFAWENARGFYGLLGVDVESGVKEWTDTEAIRDMRMLHSRIVLPEKKETKEVKKGGAQRNNRQNLRCCALYQKKACEQGRDHPPFTHACSYCTQVTGMSYRHPEVDCFRKSIDE